MGSLLIRLMDRLVIDRPWIALLCVVVVTGMFAWFIPRFQLDASADSLLLEDDADLRYYSGVVARYGSENFLVITYTARDDLFATDTLADLTELRDELATLDTVEEVISILDVPLIDSPRTTLGELQKYVRTLEDPTTNRDLARTELRNSPIYSNLLMSLDGNTTAVVVRFISNEEYTALQLERDLLRAKMLTAPLTREEEQAKKVMSERIKELRIGVMAKQEEEITRIREILLQHQEQAEINIGGLPLIVNDMISYIRSDIVVFGSGIFAFLIVLLSIIFGRPRWVVISLLCCASAALMVTGFLGLMRWPVTVVSSNFVALLLIFSLSLTVHLIQRYRELHLENPQADQRWLVRNTLLDKFQPCVFTSLTTIVGFASLLVSGIRPVIDFGWMMVVGMVVVLVTALILFPVCLMLLKPDVPKDRGDSTRIITGFFAKLADKHEVMTGLACIVLAITSLVGMSQLLVENRFIDYFKSDTDIYKGMVTIDQKLGGTAPLDVILDADADFLASLEADAEPADDEFDEDFDADFDSDFDGEFGNEFGDEADGTDLGATSYWYNTYRLGQLREVHEYLDQLPETGKVLSMATTIETLEILNQDQTPGTFFLSVLYNRLPENLKTTLFDPYMTGDGNQVRISMRVFESDPDLRRGKLINEIRSHLINEMGFAPDRVHVTGMLVLYNNVLQRLYRSQILTLGVVFISIMVMFGILFRSLKIALTAVLPSMLSVGMVLGTMGLLGIPLDIMTITIAAISVGIGVDDSIHYIHRYRQEIAVDGDARAAMHRSHASVGRALFYTSVIIIAGFSVLALSNFIPSILFGLLTGLAMAMALVANLTLLPLLLRWWSIR
jgi:predicted RND superfamily exporter protein